MHRQIEADGGMLAYRGLVIAGCIRRSRNTEMKRSGIEVRSGEKEAMHRHGGNANLQSLRMAQWLSWLERRPVTAKVEGSSPFWVVYMQLHDIIIIWDLSSAGRASALQAEGHRFEPCRFHSTIK